MEKFTLDEIAIVRRFIESIALDYGDGITAIDDAGVTVTEFLPDGYGALDTSERRIIPMIAFTDPEEHSRCVEEDKAARKLAFLSHRLNTIYTED